MLLTEISDTNKVNLGRTFGAVQRIQQRSPITPPPYWITFKRQPVTLHYKYVGLTEAAATTIATTISLTAPSGEGYECIANVQPGPGISFEVVVEETLSVSRGWEIEEEAPPA